MTSPLLTIQGAAIGYPGKMVLQHVTFTLLPGQSFAVLGPNGSGKTAFLKTVAGILSPLAGRISFNQNEKRMADRVGYVPQRGTVSGLLPLTVREIVEMGTYGSLKPWQGLGKKEHELVDWAMTEVNIGELECKPYSELSGGQQQRVLIARALAVDPTLLVLDEPLASLDQKTVRTTVALLAKLQAEPGLALLWADHLIPDLLEVVREVMLIEDMTLICKTVEDLLQQEKTVVDKLLQKGMS